MAKTDWASANLYQVRCPHTFNALQHLVMAMAGVYRNRGKKSLFGKDKGLAAYIKFEDNLKKTLLAMVLDGVIQRNAPASVMRENLVEALEAFAIIFPNWQDAYAFAYEYLVESPEVAEDRIQSLMQ